MTQGLIHLYYGDGKGKTTAAMGLALRAVGSGMAVCIAQFLKPGDSSELAILRTVPGVIVIDGDPDVRFSFMMDDSQKTIARTRADAILAEAEATLCDMLVLDEVTEAYHLDLIDRKIVEDVVRSKRDGLELVLTGRDADPFFLDAADYVTQMVCRKHPFSQGISARKGVEY